MSLADLRNPGLVDAVLLVHAAATVFLAGLSWTIHVVHYPLFGAVGGDFAAYEREHGRRITRLLALPWPVECGTALLLPLVTAGRLPVWMPVAGLVLLGVVVAATVLVAVPAHERLGAGFDPGSHRALLRGDRIRVLAWTARGVLAIAMLRVAGIG